MSVLVLQGVSGSGKSTYAKWREKQRHEAAEFCTIVSADEFFMKDGVYQFDATKLPQAHAQCLRRFVEIVSRSTDRETLLIVDNTNTSVAEIAPYMALAAAYGHEAVILRFDVDPRKAAARNTHGVPAPGVDAQYTRMVRQELPPWWRVDPIGESWASAAGLSL